jgi:hypothetical protein
LGKRKWRDIPEFTQGPRQNMILLYFIPFGFDQILPETNWHYLPREAAVTDHVWTVEEIVSLTAKEERIAVL